MAKEQQIQIIADDNGNKIRVSANNPEYAHVRLVQEKIWIAPSGWVRKRNMSALLHGKLEDLKDLGINKMKYLPGQIVITESHQGNDRDLKHAGDTGVICRVDDQPIYRVTEYDASNTKSDLLIAHTNGDEIREANSFTAATSEDKTSMVTGESFFKANEEEETDPAQTNIIDTIAEVEAEDKMTPLEQELDELLDKSQEIEEVEEEEEIEEEVEEPASFDL
tara:strand:- start:131 stop:796 length:666 start_codon:yes stop_codon:yes gene_type:complete